MRVLLTGARGMLGSSIAAAFARRPDVELLPLGRADLDLLDADATAARVAQLAPDAVVHAAARVGGIAAKLAAPTGYLLDNLRIDTSLIAAAIRAGVPELLYVGSAAVYPAETSQPIPESAMLTGALEPANEGYGLAKIAGQRLCALASAEHGVAYRTVVPSNLYGPNDDFAAGSAHLIAAALAKTDAAKRDGAESVGVWGDGTARREFSYAPDLADWLAGQVGRLRDWPDAVNVGSGDDRTVAEYYRVASEVVGFDGRLEFDQTKPSGVPRRLLDSGVARSLGWRPTTDLVDGMAAVYEAFLTAERRDARR